MAKGLLLGQAKRWLSSAVRPQFGILNPQVWIKVSQVSTREELLDLGFVRVEAFFIGLKLFLKLLRCPVFLHSQDCEVWCGSPKLWEATGGVRVLALED